VTKKIDAAPPQVSQDLELASRLRAGDERAFAELIRLYNAGVLRLVRAYVRSEAVAEEVVQEAWVGVFRGIHRFEGRSSLKGWIFGIAVNRAKERGGREARHVPFSALGEPSTDDATDADGERFQGPADRFPGGWTDQGRPDAWDENIEARLHGREVRLLIIDAITTLPPAQRLVITLRDVDGLTAAEVTSLLEISEGNQRVLLHRARSKVRRLLELHFASE